MNCVENVLTNRGVLSPHKTYEDDHSEIFNSFKWINVSKNQFHNMNQFGGFDAWDS